MKQRVTLITLGVEDLELSTQFYEKRFGWNRDESSNENITFFKLPQMLLSLFEENSLAKDAGVVAPRNHGFRGFTLSYNVPSEEEVRSTIARLKKRGVRVIKEPCTAAWGGYHAYVTDIDQYLWEICYNPYLPLDEDGLPTDKAQSEDAAPE